MGEAKAMSVLGGYVWVVVVALAMVAILLKCLAVLSTRASEKTLLGEDGEEADLTLPEQGANVSAPRVVTNSSMKSGQVTTWDCVWFGSYPQAEVAPSDPVYASLESASWDASGDATVGGRRYRRISKDDVNRSVSLLSFSDGFDSATYRYFRYEPIKWRVLKVSGTTALVASDVALDNQCYNTDSTNVTWETCSLRSWLNGYGADSNQPGTDYTSGSFVGTAFSSAERDAVLETTIRIASNTSYATPGSNDTRDRVFLLSEGELYVSGYGFTTSQRDRCDDACRCKASDYAHAVGASRSTSSDRYGSCFWWLRPGGINANGGCYVNSRGIVNRFGNHVLNSDYAVRPALNLDLSSSFIQPAGTVSSDGTREETAPTNF